MLKVEHEDLESITKFLDKIIKKRSKYPINIEAEKDFNEATRLSKMIKDKYTEIKPDYEK